MLLPVLPDELRVDLAPHGLPGVVAVLRPFDIEDKARWFDAVGGNIESHEAAVVAVRRQLIALEGVTAQRADGAAEPFDAKNPAHVRSLPYAGVVVPCFLALLSGASLSEDARKN